jgi:hypothetical protein
MRNGAVEQLLNTIAAPVGVIWDRLWSQTPKKRTWVVIIREKLPSLVGRGVIL